MLNAKKTQCMFIGTRGLLSKIPPDTHIKMDDNEIAPCSSLKNLGIYFYNHLLFDTHITEISKESIWNNNADQQAKGLFQ